MTIIQQRGLELELELEGDAEDVYVQDESVKGWPGRLGEVREVVVVNMMIAVMMSMH